MALGLSVGEGLQSKGLVPLSPAGCSLSWPRRLPGTARRVPPFEGSTAALLQSFGTAGACPHGGIEGGAAVPLGRSLSHLK